MAASTCVASAMISCKAFTTTTAAASAAIVAPRKCAKPVGPRGSSLLGRPMIASLRSTVSRTSGRKTFVVYSWFNFRGNAEDAGIVGSQGREDYSSDDVEFYFNYMGILAVEGSYATLKELLDQGNDAIDIILLMAAAEGDKPKIEEIMKAGADPYVKDSQGRNAFDRAKDAETRACIERGHKAFQAQGRK